MARAQQAIVFDKTEDSERLSCRLDDGGVKNWFKTYSSHSLLGRAHVVRSWTVHPLHLHISGDPLPKMKAEDVACRDQISFQAVSPFRGLLPTVYFAEHNHRGQVKAKRLRYETISARMFPSLSESDSERYCDGGYLGVVSWGEAKSDPDYETEAFFEAQIALPQQVFETIGASVDRHPDWLLAVMLNSIVYEEDSPIPDPDILLCPPVWTFVDSIAHRPFDPRYDGEFLEDYGKIVQTGDLIVKDPNDAVQPSSNDRSESNAAPDSKSLITRFKGVEDALDRLRRPLYWITALLFFILLTLLV